MPSVAIIHGFAEGNWHSKKLKTTLREADFTVEPDISKANVIITHSGGCFLVPEHNSAKFLLLVGVPYRPCTSILSNLSAKTLQDAKFFVAQKQLVHWLLKTFWNAYYIGRHPVRWMRMQQMRLALKLPANTKRQAVVAVRNASDSFSTPQTIQQLARKHHWQIVSLPGTHDDIWTNPLPYVAIIKSCL